MKQNLIFINFYLNEVISDASKLPVGCTLDCSKVIVLEYADDLETSVFLFHSYATTPV